MTNRYITLCQIFLRIMKSHLLFIVLPVPFVINFLFIRKQSVTPLCSVGKWLPKIFFVYFALIMDTLPNLPMRSKINVNKKGSYIPHLKDNLKLFIFFKAGWSKHVKVTEDVIVENIIFSQNYRRVCLNCSSLVELLIHNR